MPDMRRAYVWLTQTSTAVWVSLLPANDSCEAFETVGD